MLGLSTLLAVVSVLPARALMVAPPPIGQRVALADKVLVGKVVSIEPKSVKASRYPGDMEKGEFRIAVVKIEEGILGTKGLTHVRVGFLPPPPPDDEGNPGEVRPRLSSRRPQVTLAKDEEVFLFLRAHPEGTFFTAPQFFDVIRKTTGKQENPEFAKQVAEAKRSAKRLEDPKASLKAGSAADRFETAAMLLTRYRTATERAAPQTVPLDAEESRLILHALADADWEADRIGRGNPVSPLNTFLTLGLTPQDGWQLPKDFRQIAAEARKWLAANKDSYRIQRFVDREPEAKR
jgi:hypothetical protein